MCEDELVTANGDTDLQAPSGAKYRVPALEKGLEVIELLATVGNLTISQIASQLSRSMGELYRVIQHLEGAGYIERTSYGDAYALTKKLFRMAHAQPPLRSILSYAMPRMDALALATEQSCHLAQWDEANVLVIAQSDSPLTQRYSVRLGGRFPVWESSSGTLLVSGLGAEEQAVFFRRLTKIVDPGILGAFRSRVAEAAAKGYEERESYMVGGLTILSYPVRDFRGGMVAALTLPFLHHKRVSVTVAEAGAQLRHCAVALSEDLGFRHEDETPGSA